MNARHSADLFLYVALVLPVIGIAMMVFGAKRKSPFVPWQRIATWISLVIPVLEIASFFILPAAGIWLHRLTFVPLAIPPVLSLILVFGLLLSSREGQRKWFSGFLLLVGPLAFLALLGARIFTYPD